MKVGPPPTVTFTEQQIREIWARIQEIDAHFDGCCASQMDKCHHAEEFDQLYKFLHLAGAPEVKTPFTSQEFEAWMAGRVQ